MGKVNNAMGISVVIHSHEIQPTILTYFICIHSLLSMPAMGIGYSIRYPMFAFAFPSLFSLPTVSTVSTVSLLPINAPHPLIAPEPLFPFSPKKSGLKVHATASASSSDSPPHSHPRSLHP